MRILLVEDDVLLAKATAIGLAQAGYITDIAKRCQEVDHYLSVYEYNAILLDLGLPDGDGLALLKKLRNQKNTLPIVVLTARDQVKDRIEGLECGADDFVVKPYDLDEVIARIKAVIRRLSGHMDNQLTYQSLQMNLATQQVFFHEQAVILTSREFKILHLLLANQGQIFSRQRIEDAFDHMGDQINSNAVQVHIHHLRKKLSNDLIRTVQNVGYIID